MINKGFILIPVTIFILVLALLSLTTLKQLKNMWRLESLNSLMITQKNQQRKFIRGIIISNLHNCTIDPISTKSLLCKSTSWWQTTACQNEKYYYLAEDLGINPCARIGADIANFKRITVVTKPKAVQDIKSFMQVIFAMRVKTTGICKSKIFIVNEGIQQIREL